MLNSVVRLINNVEAQHRRVAIKRKAGYFYIHHPHFATVILITSLGCESIVMGVDRFGDLRVYRDAGGVLLFTIIPLFPEDFFPRVATFRLVERGTPVE